MSMLFAIRQPPEFDAKSHIDGIGNAGSSTFGDLHLEILQRWFTVDSQRAYLARATNLMEYRNSIVQELSGAQGSELVKDMDSLVKRAVLATHLGLSLKAISQDASTYRVDHAIQQAERSILDIYQQHPSYQPISEDRVRRFMVDTRNARKDDAIALKRFKRTVALKNLTAVFDDEGTAEVQVKECRQNVEASKWPEIWNSSVSIGMTFDTIIWALHQFAERKHLSKDKLGFSLDEQPRVFSRKDETHSTGSSVIRYQDFKFHGTDIKLKDAHGHVVKSSKKSVIQIFIVLGAHEGKKAVYVFWKWCTIKDKTSGWRSDEASMMIAAPTDLTVILGLPKSLKPGKMVLFCPQSSQAVSLSHRTKWRDLFDLGMIPADLDHHGLLVLTCAPTLPWADDFLREFEPPALPASSYTSAPRSPAEVIPQAASAPSRDPPASLNEPTPAMQARSHSPTVSAPVVSSQTTAQPPNPVGYGQAKIESLTAVPLAHPILATAVTSSPAVTPSPTTRAPTPVAHEMEDMKAKRKKGWFRRAVDHVASALGAATTD